MEATQPTFQLLEWHPVAVWYYKNCNDSCAICKEDCMDICQDCIAKGCKTCPIVIGECGHAFHKHCMTVWSQGKSSVKCPLCTRPWKEKMSTI
eukprot:gnl/Chilomastix_caulleri/636.p1 GENE.gnl/Chilomastix_caulleri/636~~gnl/Chilomastix_caulleri/636.p1  ORF type:complete len:93 (+),score=4.19 gnl/Chilomastix_caulleri/636:52-330(+)